MGVARNQLTSKLAIWFNERVTTAKGRVRRVATAALARKLVIALWRFVGNDSNLHAHVRSGQNVP